MKKLTVLRVPILFFLSIFLIFGSLSKQALAVGAVCTAPVPLDIVIIIDRSGSMGDLPLSPPPPAPDGQFRIYWAKLAANNLVDSLTNTGDSLLPNRIALISFAGEDEATTDLTLDAGTTATAFHSAINAITTDGSTYIAPALTAATDQLTTLGRPNAKKVVILLSDGRNWTNSGETPDADTRRANSVLAIPALQAAADTVYSIGIGSTENGFSELDEPLLQQIAKGPPGRYIPVTEAADLLDIFQGLLTNEITTIICPATPTPNLPETGIQGTRRSSTGYDFTMLILLSTSLALFNLWRYRKLKIQR